MSKVYYAVVHKYGRIHGVYPTRWQAEWAMSRARFVRRSETGKVLTPLKRVNYTCEIH